MARNVEIKARLAGFDGIAQIEPRVAGLAQHGPVAIVQDDTFFRCAQGRLKLRAFSDGEGELIFYRRADQAGPKESFYVRSPTTDPAGLRELLALAHGQAGRVRKRRTLYLVGRTRVHLDRVDVLGEFLELEVVLADGESADAGIDEAHALMARLGICAQQLEQAAYVDLLSAPMLRSATSADAGLFYRVTRETMHEHIVATWGAWDEERVQRESREDSASPHAQVVLVDGEEAGLLFVERDAAQLTVQQIYLLPRFQRRGIGRRLMLGLIDEAGRAAVPLRLRVLRVNPARQFYEKLGFVVTASGPDFMSMERLPSAGSC